MAECMAVLLPAVSQSLRGGCSVGAILATLALADAVGSSMAPPSAEELEAHVEALCDAGERADAAALSKCLSHASSWLGVDAAQACSRLSAAVPTCSARLSCITCFTPAASSSTLSAGAEGPAVGQASASGGASGAKVDGACKAPATAP